MTTGHSRACVTHASLTPCYDIDTLYPPDVKKKKKEEKKRKKEKVKKKKEKKKKTPSGRRSVDDREWPCAIQAQMRRVWTLQGSPTQLSEPILLGFYGASCHQHVEQITGG